MLPRPAREQRGELALEHSLFVAITAFRWVAWAWMATVLAIDVENSTAGSAESVAHPVIGFVGVGVALAYTVWASFEVRSAPGRLDTLPAILVDVLIALALVFLDPWIYQSSHSQGLGTYWAIASVLSAGVAFAGRGGFAAGLTIGLGRWVGLLLWEPGRWHGDRVMGSVAGVVIYSLAGAVAGFAAIKLREAEREISAARAREEVARKLHDGVLQTLAVVQRRSHDPDLVDLAHEQEQDLRSFLFGDTQASGRDLAAALRSTAGRVERTHGGRVQVVTADDLPPLAEEVTEALTGAVAEALTNAAKHARASRVVVYAEPEDGGVFCSVKDDGCGFDPDVVSEGVGLSRSIRDRVHEVGGRAEVQSRPGRGTEVRLRWHAGE